MLTKLIKNQGRRFVSITHDLLMGTSLSSLSLLSRPQKMRRYLHESLFLRESMAPRHLASRSVSDVFSISGDVRLAPIGDGDNWLNWGPSFSVDIVNLCMLCMAIRPKVIFEIGTFHGYTTLHFAINSPDDATIYTLDLEPGEASISLPVTATDQSVMALRADSCLFANRPEAAKIRRLFGDSAKFDFSAYENKIDLFFIDGSHSYEYVKIDTLNAMKCCRKGGAIAWHDYGRAGVGVSRFLSEMRKELDINVAPGGSLAFARLS